METQKFVYMFTETDETMRNLCGGKGANLGQMTKLGLPIPQGFTVTTEACNKYYEDNKVISDEIKKEIFDKQLTTIFGENNTEIIQEKAYLNLDKFFLFIL